MTVADHFGYLFSNTTIGIMGIQDRDYMKRSSDDDRDSGSSSDSRAEEMARRFFKRYPRFFLYCTLGIVILVVATVVVARFSGNGR